MDGYKVTQRADDSNKEPFLFYGGHSRYVPYSSVSFAINRRDDSLRLGLIKRWYVVVLHRPPLTFY